MGAPQCVTLPQGQVGALNQPGSALPIHRCSPQPHSPPGECAFLRVLTHSGREKAATRVGEPEGAGGLDPHQGRGVGEEEERPLGFLNYSDVRGFPAERIITRNGNTFYFLADSTVSLGNVLGSALGKKREAGSLEPTEVLGRAAAYCGKGR